VHKLHEIIDPLKGWLDPNNWRSMAGEKEYNGTGIWRHYQTITTIGRVCASDCWRFLENLKIITNALVTRVLFDKDDATRAIGVEYRKGANLYSASPIHGDNAGEIHTLHCTKEVIVSGGTYNSPQILMLSGIGPESELKKHGIQPRVILEGVGKNLQEHYEVAVVNEVKKPWKILKDANFNKDDKDYHKWDKGNEGPYISNGTVLAVTHKSFPDRPTPDLFLFGLLGDFHGYYPGYSSDYVKHAKLHFSWVILHAHNVNHGGTVTLRSADPRDTPIINYHYYEEGTDKKGEDLAAMVEGLKIVRKINSKLNKKGKFVETLPGNSAQTNEELQTYIRDNTWGHHASSTCPIGDATKGGVLNTDFCVHGTRGLRVVDASVFPKIPGFFVACPIYMIGEKAADVILQKYK